MENSLAIILLWIIIYLSVSFSFSYYSILLLINVLFSYIAVILFSLIAFSYLEKSLLALSNIKSHKTSNEYLYLISFFSNNSATSVIFVLTSSTYLHLPSTSFSNWIILSNESSKLLWASFVCFSKSSHN